MNTSEIPSGGWQFHQPQTGWDAPHPTAFTFSQQTTNIIKHRLSQRAITIKYKLATDEFSVGQELLQYNIVRGAIPQAAIPKPEAPFPRQGYGALAAAGNMATGLSNLMAWTDDGRVVDKEKAEARATVCSGCSQNGKGDWTRFFTVPAAEIIRKQLGMKNDMSLATTKDMELGVCEVCSCPLTLKVWSPLEYALRKMADTTKQALPNHCWMKTEVT